jgi:Domain of unknown function (DUF6429)
MPWPRKSLTKLTVRGRPSAMTTLCSCAGRHENSVCPPHWDAMDRLHAKGMISEPRSKAKSVTLTDEGRAEAERLFKLLFTKA